MINSIGLQGPGLSYWMEDILPQLIDKEITVVLSIWGRTIEDYAAAADLCSDLPTAVKAVELNISCPNVEDAEKCSPILLPVLMKSCRQLVRLNASMG